MYVIAVSRLIEMTDKTLITIIAIISVVILEAIALMMGIDGQIFATVISVIAGLGGYTIGRKINETGENN